MNLIEVAPNTIFVRAEELGSKPSTLEQPTTLRERISSIDVLRGFALLGILVMNIDDFAAPEAGHDIPIGTAFVGPHAHLNLVILILKWVFFEGKMRAIFSMLFGAGVVLMTTRAEKRGGGGQIADIYLRRNMWLLLIGLLHGCLLWNGDILFTYAFTALLLLYPLRKLRAKTLLLAGTFISLVLATYALMQVTKTADDLSLHRKDALVAADRLAGRTITPEQKEIEAQWVKRVNQHKFTEADLQKEVTSAHAGYWTGVEHRLLHYVGPTAASFDLFNIIEFLGAMMMGMGLFKTGFLTAESSYTTYAWTAVIGFLLSVPLYVIGIWKVYASGFFFLDIEKWLYAPYYLPREAGALAIAAVVMIAIKSGVLRPLQHALAAVGQTALSNYLLTTVICQFIFLWGPWKLFGKLEYYQAEYVLLFVWAVNLIASPLWLRIFQFGPVEWLWRSLTYVKLQPMLKRRSA
ncbi:DUF418 domain-containing protein [Granulicella mallensis]|uniref:DUF418 domain-containing protein n=1 Tax=Granulicella mallensis TaxID=940614 RepID=A0A7W7ZQR6_9BACT|nr:DUF418 domain-containing protein [Granulicella mallensis]MBB5063551.1 uncharacterized protein [Granulicella mallensis]